MNVRSTLFGSRRRIAVVVIVVVLLGVVGAVAVGLLGAPAVTDVENRFGGVNETTTVVESDLTVSNPNPFGASLGGLTVDYAVDMNEIRMARGTKEGVSLPRGTSEVPLTTRMANERIPRWWVSHVRNAERTALVVNADVHSSTVGATFDAPQVTRTVETDLLSQFNSSEPRPVNASAPLVSDPVLYVNETSATWGEVTNETTELRLRFVVYNPRSYPVGLTELGYDVSMNDVALATGRTDGEVLVPPKSTRTVTTTARLQNGRLDEWWVSHLERNQVSRLEIDFTARLDLRATTVRVPLPSVDYTKTVETDIFGTKPEETASGTTTSTPTAAPTDDGNGDDTATSTTPTATPVTEPTATATPTATPTDDGGLLGGGDDTATSEPTATPTARPTGTPTPTDDGGLLGDRHAHVR